MADTIDPNDEPGGRNEDDFYLQIISVLLDEWDGPEDAAAYDALAGSPGQGS